MLVLNRLFGTSQSVLFFYDVTIVIEANGRKETYWTDSKFEKKSWEKGREMILTIERKLIYNFMCIKLIFECNFRSMTECHYLIIGKDCHLVGTSTQHQLL